jgi:hypothetical protein
VSARYLGPALLKRGTARARPAGIAPYERGTAIAPHTTIARRTAVARHAGLPRPARIARFGRGNASARHTAIARGAHVTPGGYITPEARIIRQAGSVQILRALAGIIQRPAVGYVRVPAALARSQAHGLHSKRGLPARRARTAMSRPLTLLTSTGGAGHSRKYHYMP